ncbi:MAG: ABC transporter ATP-binding protein [Erysipelothrix sp.]
MQYFKGYKFKSVLAVLAKTVEAVFELMMPLLMATLIDVGIVNKDMNTVYRMVIWMFVLTILGYFSSLVCQYYASEVSQKVGSRIRLKLFKKINTFSLAEYDQYSSAVLTNRITTDVNLIQEMIARVIRLGVRAPILMVGSIFALNQISPQLAMYLLYSFPVFVVIVVAFMWLSMRGHKKAQSVLDTLVKRVKEQMSGVRIIRAFSKNEFENEKFAETNQQLARKQRNVGWITTLSTPFTSLIMNFVLLILVYFGALQIDHGSMTQGQIIAVINYCTQLVLTLIVSMNLVMVFSRGYTSSLRVKEIMNVEPSIKNEGTLKTSKGAMDVVFDNVSFSYPGEKRKVVKNINLHIKPGTTLGIIGLTGSGKSTLIKLLPRFYDATEGRILINQEDIRNYELNDLRNHIGYVSQTAQFLSQSIENNITMKKGGNPKQSLQQAQGNEIMAKGLDSKIEVGGTNLSGGQRQRLNIARELNKNPQLLIFDDSFSALDFLTDRRLREDLYANYKDTTKVFISQRTTSIMHADEIIVLEDGKVSAQGTHQWLLENNRLYHEIHSIQTQEDDHGTH